MKRLTVKLSLAAVLTMVAVTAAPAQTMTVSIPFAFRANGVELAEGTYALTSVSGGIIHFLRDQRTGKATFLSLPVASDVPAPTRASGRGFMTFNCASEDCELRRIWLPGAWAAYDFASRSRQEGRRLSVLRVISENAH